MAIDIDVEKLPNNIKTLCLGKRKAKIFHPFGAKYDTMTIQDSEWDHGSKTFSYLIDLSGTNTVQKQLRPGMVQVPEGYCVVTGGFFMSKRATPYIYIRSCDMDMYFSH